MASLDAMTGPRTEPLFASEAQSAPALTWNGRISPVQEEQFPFPASDAGASLPHQHAYYGLPADAMGYTAAEPGPSLMSRVVTLLEEVFAWFKTLVSAAVYATLIVTFGFQVARVEGQSMAPTLENQDRLIVNKFQYLIDSPRPGDIVMLRYPVDPDKSFVKRVIAEEGDAVRIEDGVVYVNDVAIKDDFVPDAYRGHDDHDTEIVKKGYYYVLGDHRNNSSDSREWGLVPKKYIMGRVQLRWWPVPHARVF